ncbi:aspartate dehydrogenase [Larsenimonas rhizosphaerae]|uniref:aspartate dehydrogenase n=1 Tax=Larsenimonas rhizosphaerae TaxID=2944682 RepID=UPI0020345984|nr:aspartate dehydrogenase [Larsenimonas rhizosphaerae]MCM2129520.1 aspartate dehydrogenase [Larsenimonas rhizosphaerae]
MTHTIMMIGYGAMGREVHRLLPEGVVLDCIIEHPAACEALQRELGDDIAVVSSVAACRVVPALVLECAGQPGLRAHGADVLRQGWSLAVISVGALADPTLYAELCRAAEQGSSRFEVLAGAVAGMDGLAAAREGGLDTVTYEARKAPRSWQGSHADTLVALDRVTEPAVFFEGSAGEAALLFPANANVAATVALAGVGMEATTVRLVVDPHTTRNTHRIVATGRFGEFAIELSGYPLEANPKTSTLAALSVVRACRRLVTPALI